ncbi:hypothetical protein JYU34_015922 [Plutella xylostella]|uniref:Ubiquitin carboxyl-terminal hydrolase n=1 Tax=Plutella xylostella TaxID=51655 RepID=A0ABQ7Q515_PLUXY|nr:hypothetical protein JYU34_015922 [Plutella xylostella]
MDCVHVVDHVKVVTDHIVQDDRITKSFDCSECSVKDQIWLCLQCGAVHCGRYVNGHAEKHAQATDHQLCISCDNFSVYCYKCDDYVSSDTDDQIIGKLRKVLQQNSRVNDKDGLLEQSEENSKDGSLVSNNSSVQNAEQPSSPLGAEERNASSSETPEGNDMKVPTTSKIEEPVRNLRPRSRKRSHSEDSSSAENSSKKVEKKLSSINGKSPKDRKVVGLKNLGNTCFMNAVLQSLSNIQEFSCYFSSLPSLEMKTNGRKVYHSRSYTRQEMTDLVMAEELRKVLINLSTGGCGSKGAISPECLFLVIWKVVPRFRGYQQQDAHEFLRYMLDRLHTELQQLLPAEGKDAARSASIVTAVFGGTLQSEVRCLACGAVSKKLDPFLDLSLELPDLPASREPAALPACLASFLQVEELADTERYHCASCKCKQKSTKQFWLRRLPNVLCLHLKRFRWHNYFRTKVDTSISFPLSALDMSQFVPASGRGERALYDLAAVIVHHGSGAGSGHYTAFAINEDQWFHFNDQTVRATDAETVASCKPYILFYIRREISLPPLATAL